MMYTRGAPIPHICSRPAPGQRKPWLLRYLGKWTW